MVRLRMSSFAVATVLVAMGRAYALAADSGSGAFHFGKIQVVPVDSLAYSVPAAAGNPAMTVVLLTDFKIDRTAAIDAIDTVNAVLQQASTHDPGNLVVLRILGAGRCGVSAFLNQGQRQIDLGNSFAAKAGPSTATHLSGSCWTTKPGQMFDDAYDFRLPYDIAVTPIPQPSVLVAGGAEPGIAYAALVKAIQTADWTAATPHLPSEEVPKARPDAAGIKEYFHGLALNYPKTVKVMGGLMKGDRANLDIEGTNNEGKKIKGTVALKKSASGWRVLDQSFYFTE
jgi:hypothetical protein